MHFEKIYLNERDYFDFCKNLYRAYNKKYSFQ